MLLSTGGIHATVSSCEIVVLWVLLLFGGKLLWQIAIPHLSTRLVRLELTRLVGFLIDELLMVERWVAMAVHVITLWRSIIIWRAALTNPTPLGRKRQEIH